MDSADTDIEPALLERLRAGGRDARAQVYRRFERRVFTLAVRMLGDRAAAEDVLQESMIAAFERIGQFRGDAPFWTWLRRIAANFALMRLRRSGRLLHLDDVPEAMDEGPQPWQLVESARLIDALGTLPAATRSVLWLYHVEGFTHEEIANLMGKTASFSKSQLMRGTRRLREVFTSPAEGVRNVD